MPIFVRIWEAARIPYLAVHDSDRRPRRKPIRAERGLSAEIARLAGPGHTMVLTPDFEAVAGLRGHHHKPARAWEPFSTIEQSRVPGALRRVVERVVELASD
jgi:hypothetical protein